MSMNATAPAAASVQPAAQATSQQKPPDSTEGFAQILNTLNAAASQQSTAAQNTTPTAKLSWREVQSLLSQMSLDISARENLAQMPGDMVTDKLMEMLKQIMSADTSQDIGSEDLISMADLGQEIQKRLKKMLEENGHLAAAQQLMAMLIPPQDRQIPGSAEAAKQQAAAIPQEILQEIVQTKDPAALLQMVADFSENYFEKPLQGAMEQQKAQTTHSTTQQFGQTEKTAAQDDLQLQVVHLKQSGAQQQQDPQEAFRGSIRAAKQQMEQTAGAKPTAEKQQLDVDALQRQVDSGAYLKNTALGAPNAEMLQSEPIALATQVQDGILAAMEQGTEQFSIKLSPEGLGELTIRLTKTAEGMTLNLIAKNSETQKLLSNELNGLRDSLRHLRVEVDSVITERQESLLSQQQSFEQQARQNWQDFKGAAYYKDEPLGQSEAAPEQEAPPIVPPAIHTGSAALDAYI